VWLLVMWRADGNVVEVEVEVRSGTREGFWCEVELLGVPPVK